MQDILAQTSRAFLKPIEAFLNDPEVSEIMINGPHEIYVEKKGKLIKTTAQFEDEEQLMAAVRNIAQFVGRKIEKITPILDARLADGSRIHVIIPPKKPLVGLS
jgi:pilus assembly protein CpaF